MSIHGQDRRDKRSETLNQLRAHFGQDRSDELGDMDGLGLLTAFLRRLPDDNPADPSAAEALGGLSREELQQLRRRRREKGRGQAQESAGEQKDQALGGAAQEGQAAAVHAMTYSALIEEIPRMRENFGEWLSSVESDYLGSSSTREELELLRSKAEYRLKLLKVMVNETQKEIESLTLAMKASEAASAD